MSEPKVGREVAEAEFDRFCEAMDLDVDPTGMSAEDLQSLEKHKRPILKAMMEGSLVIDEKGQPVYTLQGDAHQGETLTFAEHTGATLMETGAKGKDQEVKKMLAVMAAQTKRSIAFFSSMKGRDLRVCMGLTALFLG